MAKIRALHYLNQFFAGLGGEEQAGLPPQWFDGARGPGLLLERLVPEIEIVATIAAGDNYMAEDLAAVSAEITALIAANPAAQADVLIAGPAFNAGRYGMACASVCDVAQSRLQIPALTAMYDENPAVEAFRKRVTMVRSDTDVMGMRPAVEALARAALKLSRGEAIDPDIDGTILKGLRENVFDGHSGAVRALDMLLKKLDGADFVTEYPMPDFDRVPPAPAVANVANARVALVTSGGIVPRGNPDHIEAASASKYGAYSLEGVDCLRAETHQSVHGGYDNTYANDDPNRVLPLDVIRDLEREGRIGSLHETYYATVGNATSVEQARRFGAEIAAALVKAEVRAAIFTST